MAYQSPFTGFQIDTALAKANAALPADDASLTQLAHGAAFATDLAGQAARSLTGSVPGQPPASATAPGQPGQIAHDSEYFYLCVALNTWKRSPLTTWP